MIFRIVLVILAVQVLWLNSDSVDAINQRHGALRQLQPREKRKHAISEQIPDPQSPSHNATTLAVADATIKATAGVSRKQGMKAVSYALDGTVLDTKHDDPLEQVIDFITRQEELYRNDTRARTGAGKSGRDARSKLSLLLGDEEYASASNSSFLEIEAQVGKVHAFCEICILIMQMKERGQPHLCAGLNPDYFISCVENLESLLRADKAVVYWLRSGCMHLDREGPEIVRPCPAHAICAWVPNLFADVGIVTPRNELSPLCPRDFKYLPRIPRKPVQVATIT